MIRKGLVAAVVSGLMAGCIPPSATAAEFHSRDLQRAVAAEWSSCGAVPIGERCAFTDVQAFQTFEVAGDSNGKQGCVAIIQVRGSNADHQHPDLTEPYEFTDARWGCGAVSVFVAASLAKGEVRGELPGQDCHVVPRMEPTCVTAPVSIALEWRSSGDTSRSPGLISHQSPIAPDERCLEHVLPYRSTFDVSVTGQVDGLSAPVGELTNANMAFGEVIQHGTIPFCFD